MAHKSFNEVLKAREAAEKLRKSSEASPGKETHIALDDTQRVKVLSPGRLVFKRFVRNKLAIVGSAILLFMFIFAFLGPAFYSYGQTQIFYKYADQRGEYASAAYRKEYFPYVIDESVEVNYIVKNRFNTYIFGENNEGGGMEELGLETLYVKDNDANNYVIRLLGEKLYTLNALDLEKTATFSRLNKLGTYSAFGLSFDDPALQTAIKDAIAKKTQEFKVGEKSYYIQQNGKMQDVYELTAGKYSFEDGYYALDGNAAFTSAVIAGIENSEFEYNNEKYYIQDNGGYTYTISKIITEKPALLFTSFVFDAAQGKEVSSEFKSAALSVLYTEKAFSIGADNYEIREENGTTVIYKISGDGNDTLTVLLTDVSVRRANGNDDLSAEFKELALEAVEKMIEANEIEATFECTLPKQGDDGKEIPGETENAVIDVVYNKGYYTFSATRVEYLIDIYGEPSSEHIFGTDGDGMDILARMMFGGRISLLVGFVVVIIETIIGVILGGIAGYFGKWIDTLIMRLVDIFNCIPSMPILIILGAFFDELKMDPYVRLMWLMALLGFLGWASVARLVRGQILSLREQEFMVATEATGLKTRRKIARHLIPNVMPQLIVSATMGLGSVILTESTLSFLGLGVKHPLATWGTMINSVSDTDSMIRYAYIWVPVGLLICLTVIAFNFVGDGLRDAFDPKMKR